MKIAFYKAYQDLLPGEKRMSYMQRLWLDWFIAAMSFGRYSHVELIDSKGLWFSISPRSDTIKHRRVIPKPGRWTIINLNLTDSDIILVENEFAKYAGKRYDYLGAAFSITLLCVNFKDKLFCSEVCANILRKTTKYKELPKGCTLSPTDLHKRIKDR